MEKKEVKEIIVKKTAQHTEGTKYLERAKEGPISAPVYFQENGNKIEATVDGEPIGFVVDKTFVMPVKYEAKITGLGEKPNTFAINVVVLESRVENVGENTDLSEFANEIEYAKKVSGLTDIEERVKVMINNSVPSSLIKVTLMDYHKVEHPHAPGALYRNVKPKGEISFLSQALMAAHNRQAIICQGEKSTGKNVFTETVAYCRGESFTRVTFQKDMLLEQIFGTQTTDNSAADRLEVEKALAMIKVQNLPEKATDADYKLAAEFEVDKAKSACIRLVHEASDIIRWAKEGGVCLYDEVNMCAANVLQAVMNSVADNEKVLVVPGIGAIKLNEKCVLLAGMNPGYAGTMELNAATKSRCGFINFELPDSIIEQLKTNFKEGEVPEQYFSACEAFYKELKALVSIKSISSDCLNIRGFVNAIRNVASFPDVTTLKTEINTFVVAGCNEDERGTIEDILDRKINI